MKKILISFNNDVLNIRYKIDKTKEEKDLTKTLMNTNVISNDELIFSDSYLKNNISIMTSFLSEIIKEKKINKMVIEEFDIVPIVLDITNNIKYITKLYIIPDIIIDYKIYERLASSNYLKYVNCFEIPSFMLEKLCNEGLVVDIRCEILSISNFIYQNNLVNYTKLYYRKTIKIFTKLNSEDLNDFETFCQINRNLKTIYIYDFDIEMIKKIYLVLNKTNKRNFKILICQNLENTELINSNMKDLKIINRSLIKNCDAKIKITYSLDYISKNFIKQLSLTNLRTCLLIILCLEIVALISVKSNNYRTKKNIDQISNTTENIDPLVSFEENTSNLEENNDVVTSAYNTNYEEDFDKLFSINGDTRAWLKVNNTSINYPIVQTIDNEYYLDHDFNHDTNSNGWVFIDYRNNIDLLDQNTIIYGHNANGASMFSHLKYALQDSWYTNQDNLDIIFDTPSFQFKAKIFSIYVDDNTDDYLHINFSNQDYEKFINLIKDRSIYNFDVDYTLDDKMITLCTLGGASKLVIHAKIM